jgi:hypothetical protein
LQMAEPLYRSTDRDPTVGQTYAMALAETGDFEAATRVQQDAIAALKRLGARAPDPFLTRSLGLYQRRKPSREGWSADDPLLQPRSPAARLATNNP